MTGLLKALSERILGRSGQAKGEHGVALQQRDFKDGPVWAVGDVHGCATLYKRLERILQSRARANSEPCSIVLLGDVVDRGAETADLLDHLGSEPPDGVSRTCLLGNHEEMMLRFFEQPKRELRWLGVGGYETLSSYGLSLDVDTASTISERKLRHLLEAHVPPPHLALLRQFSAGMIIGRYVLVHASLDSDRPLDRQSRQTLLWGAPPEIAPRGMTVVHGHTIVDAPVASAVRISVDTGAWRTSRLTAVRLHPTDEPVFLTVDNEGFHGDAAPGSI